MKLISKILREYGMYIAVIIAVIIIKTYMISPIIVNGDSMYSTLYDGDIMILNKMAYSK